MSAAATSPATALPRQTLQAQAQLCAAEADAVQSRREMTSENISIHVPCLGRYEKKKKRTSVSHSAFSFSKEGFNTKLCRRFIF